MSGYGVLGHAGEYKPRFGLWLDTSPECQQAVKGLVAEGYDCEVVLKFGARCAEHSELTFRPVISLRHYLKLIDAGNVDCYPAERCRARELKLDPVGCYLREVFFPERLNLRKEGGRLCGN